MARRFRHRIRRYFRSSRPSSRATSTPRRSRSRNSISKATAARTTSPSKPATGRVFVSRATHMMVVDGATGKVLGDIPNTPGVHGAGIATKAGHGFTTNGGDQTVTMFDLKTLARDQADQGRTRSRRHHVRRARRQDHPHEPQPPDRHPDRDRSEDRRHRRHRRARGQGARRAPPPTARATSSSTTKARTRSR